MKYAHHLDIRVFCKEQDDEEKIIEKLNELVPFDSDKEKINFEKKTVYGFEDKKIKIYSISVDKQRHTNQVIENLMSNLSREQKDLLLKQLESRLDKDLHFYIRLDKDKLLEGEYWITDTGNCFHIQMTIAAYPHTRETARKIVNKILQ